MALSASTLSTQLQNLTPTSSEATAITNLVDAYGAYAASAAALTTISTAGINSGKAAMQSVLSGMSTSGAGLTLIPNAVIAFWTAVAANLASFSGATAITPPPHATIVASFATITAANKNGSASLADSCAAIAANWHTNAVTEGTVTTAGPTVTAIL